MTVSRLHAAFGFAVLALAMGAGTARAADEAKGTFRFGKLRVQPADALAYLEAQKGQAPVTVVVVTDFKIDRAAVLEAIDTGAALVQQVLKKGAGNIVTIRTSGGDACGVRAYLGESSQFIELADSFPARSKTATGARVAGECFTKQPGKMFDDAYEFRLSYDLPLTAIPQPSPTPPGGGAPGAALMALVNAIRAADWKVAHLHLRQEELPPAPPKAAETKEYFRGISLNYPKTAKVTGGLIKGDLAQIEIVGTNNEAKRVKGTFAMRKVGPDWRVVDFNLFYLY